MPVQALEDPPGRDGTRAAKGRTGAGVGNTVGNDSRPNQDKKKGNRISAIPLCFLVAGPGFEPGTFGL